MERDEGQAPGGTQWGRETDVPAPVPFGETSNPADYVPREATEEALLAVERAIRAGRCAALTTPPGLGKSLLLRLMERRLTPEFQCLFLAYGALSISELCAWALGLMGEPAGEDPPAALLRHARRASESGRVLLLLIDDGGSMPIETARELGSLVRESGNRLRLVIAGADDATSSRVLSVVHPKIVDVRCSEPMTRVETRLYVETRLEQAGVSPELRGRFHEDAIGWIHRLSGGIPRRIHDLAGSLLDVPPDGVGSSWQDERWLGAPIDDVDASLLGDLPSLPEILAKRPGLAMRETLLDGEEDDIDLL